jgi:ABC-type multidrug transport system fused ATPase/permease subunit
MSDKKENKEKIKLSKDSYKKAGKFFKFMKPYSGVYAIGWIFLILSSVTAMLFPLLMGKLFGTDMMSEKSISSPVSESLTKGFDLTNVDGSTIFILLIIVFGAQAIFSFFRIVLFSIVTEKTLRDIKTTAFDKLIHYPIDFYNRHKVGELTSRIATDINLLQDTLNTTIAEFFRQFITIFIGVGYIIYVSPTLALWMLGVVPVVAVVAVLFGRKVKLISKQAQTESAESNSILEEVLMGITNVKAFTNEFFELKRYTNKVDNVAKLSIKNGLVRGAFVSFIVFALFGSIVFIIWKAKTMVGIDITEGEFYSFILYTIFVGASFGSLPNLYANIQKAIGSTEHLMNLINEDVEDINQGEELKVFKGNVTFDEVYFHYPSRIDVEVLKGISFKCNSGETTALVGSSGAGKSTIANLLLKFYDVDKGQILFDDINIAIANSKSLRQHIAVVPQEVILFSGSIKENIAYGNLEATDDEIFEAAKKANALEFIERFPEKMGTLVGDRGIQLSGGQRQRIAIARAVLSDPKILILDEATSALDTESEKLVQDALDKLMENRTSFVIAHRLSTIKNADNILVLENGKIIQQGKHNDLIKDVDGVYYKLNNSQLG